MITPSDDRKPQQFSDYLEGWTALTPMKKSVQGKKRDYEIIKADSVDPDDLAAFLGDDSPGSSQRRAQSASYYQWLVGPTSTGDASAWVAVSGDTVIGSLVASPRTLRVGKSKIVAGKLEEMKTAQEWRGRGVLSALFQAILKQGRSEGFDLLLGGPTSPQSYPIYVNRLGFEAPFTIANNFAPVWLPVLDGLNKNVEFRTVGLGRLGDYAEFAEEVMSGSDVATVRDSDYLGWRYYDHPDRYESLEVLHGERLIGFCTVKLILQRNLPTVNVVEMAARPGSVQCLVLSAVRKWAISKSARFMVFWPPLGGGLSLARAGFLPRFGSGVRFVMRALSEAGDRSMDTLRKRDSWWLSMGDMLHI